SIFWIPIRIFLHHTRNDRFGFRLRLLERLSLAQSADDIQIVATTGVDRGIAGRRPQFDSLIRLKLERGFEALRQDADNSVVAPVKSERLAEDTGIGREFPPPEIVTEDHHVVLFLGLLFESERSTERHRRA